jgi:hypothetical protein
MTFVNLSKVGQAFLPGPLLPRTDKSVYPTWLSMLFATAALQPGMKPSKTCVPVLVIMRFSDAAKPPVVACKIPDEHDGSGFSRFCCDGP